MNIMRNEVICEKIYLIFISLEIVYFCTYFEGLLSLAPTDLTIHPFSIWGTLFLHARISYVFLYCARKSGRITANPQSLGDSKKRIDVFMYMKAKHKNKYYLQDTHFTSLDEILKQNVLKVLFSAHKR